MAIRGQGWRQRRRRASCNLCPSFLTGRPAAGKISDFSGHSARAAAIPAWLCDLIRSPRYDPHGRKDRCRRLNARNCPAPESGTPLSEFGSVPGRCRRSITSGSSDFAIIFAAVPPSSRSINGAPRRWIRTAERALQDNRCQSGDRADRRGIALVGAGAAIDRTGGCPPVERAHHGAERHRQGTDRPGRSTPAAPAPRNLSFRSIAR